MAMRTRAAALLSVKVLLLLINCHRPWPTTERNVAFLGQTRHVYIISFLHYLFVLLQVLFPSLHWEKMREGKYDYNCPITIAVQCIHKIS